MLITRGAKPERDFALVSNALLRDESLSFRARGKNTKNLALDGLPVVKLPCCAKIADGIGVLNTPLRYKPQPFARSCGFSDSAYSFCGSVGSRKTHWFAQAVASTPTHRSTSPLAWGRGVLYTPLGAIMASSSLDAQRQSVSVSAALPASFTVLAEAFLCYLHDSGATTSSEAVFIESRVFGLCIAGGINQRNEGQMLQAQNYIYSALGLALSEAKKYEAIPPGQSCITVSSERPGHVYILRNPSLPGLVKIGYTCLTVADRVQQLSRSTSIPMPFEVVASFRTSTPVAQEADIHALLAVHRMPGREFFSISEARAIAACKTIIKASA